jgi:hypothetical protein
MAVNAGVDLLWICHAPALQNRAIDVLIKAAERSAETRHCLEQSSRRLDALMKQYVKAASTQPNLECIGSAVHRDIVAQIERRVGKISAGEDPTEAFIRSQPT